MTSSDPAVRRQVLHADLVLLREDASDRARDALMLEASALASLPGVAAIGAIEAAAPSDFDLAFFFILDSQADLEAFGTDERYIRFLQGGLARAMRSFAGADVQLDSSFAGDGAYAACACLIATPHTYDWQVRDALAAWSSAAAQALRGLAIGERQRYRGLGIMFSSSPIPLPFPGLEGFGTESISGTWRRLR
ncbi:MAG TPA: hypothetical protein VNN10_01960 [Dehalococcoidia bacterium]|nr:hypothetical protein [Dehalococcoidia bacterium]